MTEQPENGIALCLSGGGFRATLFHLGALRRLNEFGVLSRCEIISSVSGGSILNGLLAARWKKLAVVADVITNFEEEVAAPVRKLCSEDLRTPLLIGARLNPLNWPRLLRDYFSVSANILAESYEPHFRMRLGELPAPGLQTPRFIFCAANVRTGACWHFHGGPQARMGDFYFGYCDATAVRLSDAVAASSAFPPGFSALRMRLPRNCEVTRVDPWHRPRPVSAKRHAEPHGDAGEPVLLTDGGVYDNLAVEPVWDRGHPLIVSDAGRPFGSIRRASQALLPRLRRAIDIGIDQMGAVRRRWLMEQLVGQKRRGTIWTIHTLLEEIPKHRGEGYKDPVRGMLKAVRTDLNAFSEGEIRALENHGYALADATMCSFGTTLGVGTFAAPFNWPSDHWADHDRAQTALAHSEHRNIFGDLVRMVARRFGRSTT